MTSSLLVKNKTMLVEPKKTKKHELTWGPRDAAAAAVSMC
jgi:hypothetical protein